MANITSWFWEFGDGTVSNEQNPVHIYTMAGAYVVTLTVTDSLGRSSSTTMVAYIYDFEYDESVPNSSITNKCYRLPVKGNEGFGVSEFTDSLNQGSDWIWPPAMIQIGKAYDSNNREIALVLDAKTQREYQINDTDVWREREGTYEGNIIKSEIRQRAVSANEGEHIAIRHIEHHEYFKSYDRPRFQNQPGYDSEGMPIGFKIDNLMFINEDPYNVKSVAKTLPIHGDLVFQEKIEARNLQLSTVMYGAPFYLTGIVPYYETIDKQASPSLRIMTENNQEYDLTAQPYFHVTRGYNPILNLATGGDANG